MQADGTILIDTSINEDGFVAGTKDLELAMRRMAKTVEGISDKAKIALQKQVDSFSKLNNQYAQQAKKVDELKKKVAEYENQKMPTQEYEEIQQQIDGAQKRMDSLIQKQQKFLDMGGSRNSKAYKSMQYDIDELANTIRYAKGELTDLEDSGKAFTFGTNTEAAQRDMEKLAREESKLEDINNRLGISYKSLKQKVSDYQEKIKKADNSQKKAAKSGESLNKATHSGGMSMAKMLGTSILFSMVFQAISAVMNGVKEGMDNLAQYSGETNATLSGLLSSLTQLKNAFATAFSPILTAVAPALNYLIGLLTAAATAVAQLVAALTGKNTFVKAAKVQQDYAASLKNTGGAAKEAGKDVEKMLAPFDDLIQIEKPAAETGGGGGELSPGEMFETVPVDNALTDAIDEIKKKAKELKEIFKEGFFDGIGDLSVLDSLSSSIASISGSLKEIFSNPEVINGFQEMVESLTYDVGRVSGSFVSIGLTIADNLLGGFGKFLAQNKERIKSDLISLFDITSSIGTIVADFDVAAAQIFSVFRGENAKQLTADIINIFYTSFTGILELAGKFGRDVLNAIVTPIVENSEELKAAIDNTLAPIQEMVHTISDIFTKTFEAINEVYDKHIKPLFDSFTEGVSEIVESLLNGYNTYIAPVLDHLSQKFTSVWSGTIDPLLQNFIGVFGDLADLVKVVWENIFQPVVNWIAQNIMPAVAPVIEAMGNLFFDIFRQIGETLDGFITILRGVIEFLAGVFSGDWEKAWEGIKKIFKGIWDAMPDSVKGPIKTIIGFVNKMIGAVESGVNSAIKALNNISIEVPDWVPEIGGETFGFDLDTISLPRIPQLATGTVIPPRAGEFAAILGDNKRETEVVSPLSTMKQALLEAMQESGGSGNQTITLRFEGSMSALARVLKPELDRETARKGTNLVIIGGR